MRDVHRVFATPIAKSWFVFSLSLHLAWPYDLLGLKKCNDAVPVPGSALERPDCLPSLSPLPPSQEPCCREVQAILLKRETLEDQALRGGARRPVDSMKASELPVRPPWTFQLNATD